MAGTRRNKRNNTESANGSGGRRQAKRLNYTEDIEENKSEDTSNDSQDYGSLARSPRKRKPVNYSDEKSEETNGNSENSSKSPAKRQIKRKKPTYVEDEDEEESDTSSKSEDKAEPAIKTYNCDSCDRFFVLKRSLDTHKMTCKKSEPDEAEDGGSKKSYSDDEAEKSEICNICSKGFSNAKSLAAHKTKHGPVTKMYNCNKCDRSFVYQRSLKDHLESDHKSEESADAKAKKRASPGRRGKKTAASPAKEEHECDECGKKFQRKMAYDDHMALHRKDFVCNICQKAFGKKSLLKNHEESHRDEEDSEDESKRRRSRRARSIVVLDGSFGSPRRRSGRERPAKVSYYGYESDDEPKMKIKKQKGKMKEIDMSLYEDYNLRKCFVKLVKLP